MGIEGAHLNMIKAIYEKPTASIILSGQKLKAFPPTEIRNKTRMSTFTTSIQHSIGSPGHNDQARKRNGDIQIGKEEVKLSMFTDDITVYIESPVDSTKTTRFNK